MHEGWGPAGKAQRLALALWPIDASNPRDNTPLLAALPLRPACAQQYEKNVRKGLLTDDTIGLWDSAALAEVRIPPGPRLLILAHIDQYRHILRPAMPVGKYLPHD